VKTFKLTVTEDELKAMISYHSSMLGLADKYDIETSERIHTLTKRLNKETPEIESDPRPQEVAATEQVKIPEGW
jgi:hypothetical protein